MSYIKKSNQIRRSSFVYYIHKSFTCPDDYTEDNIQILDTMNDIIPKEINYKIQYIEPKMETPKNGVEFMIFKME